jgi:activating signal cointegrator 1
MKVISIMQPWATLIALGEKKFETRSWATKYRGELAIHASKKIDRQSCKTREIAQTLNKHGIVLTNDLPTGAIIAVCEIKECHKVTMEELCWASVDGGEIIKGNEFIFGDYSVGRFAWELSDVKMLRNPILAKGQLGLWNYPNFLEDNGNELLHCYKSGII